MARLSRSKDDTGLLSLAKGRRLVGLSWSLNVPAGFMDAFAVVGTDFRRRESFGRQKIGICLLHRGTEGSVALPHVTVAEGVFVVTLWLSGRPPTQGETWK
jgi:hypothetical protein